MQKSKLTNSSLFDDELKNNISNGNIQIQRQKW